MNKNPYKVDNQTLAWFWLGDCLVFEAHGNSLALLFLSGPDSTLKYRPYGNSSVFQITADKVYTMSAIYMAPKRLQHDHTYIRELTSCSDMFEVQLNVQE